MALVVALLVVAYALTVTGCALLAPWLAFLVAGVLLGVIALYIDPAAVRRPSWLRRKGGGA